MDQKINQSDVYSKLDMILIGGSFFMFFVFLYFIKETLSPVLLAFTLFLLLIPVLQYKIVKNLLVVTLVLFLIWMASGMVSILLVFIFGILIAYLLHPLIEILEKKINRTMAVILVLLLIFFVFGLILGILVPALLDSIKKFYVPETIENIKSNLDNSISPYLNQLGFNDTWKTEFISNISSYVKNLFSNLQNVSNILIDLFKQVLYLFILPFFIYYVLVDWNKIINFVRSLFSTERQSKFDFYSEKVDSILNSYIRGLITIAALNAIDVTLVLYLFGHDYPILIGLISGLFTFIPQFGVIISIIFNTLISLTTGRPNFFIPVTIIVLLAHNILETALINPKLVGKKINVHPALLIVSIFVFAYLFGFLGLFLAAPVTAILVTIFEEWTTGKSERIINSNALE